MKQKKAIFPGSFDPITLGHIDIINRALKLFNTVIIGIGVNEEKEYMFDINTRKKFIESVFKNKKNVIIKEYYGLTVDFCQKEKCQHIIRGIRNNNDFEYEKTIALANYEMNPQIETLFFPSKKEHLFISSTIVKEIIKNEGNLTLFLPESIISKI